VYASVSGTYRLPLGVALTGCASAVPLEPLAAAVNQRTHVNLTLVPAPGPAEDLSPFPLLYLRAVEGASLSAADAAALREYTAQGGLLLVDNAADEPGQALCREVARILGTEPAPLAPDHEVYRAFYRLDEAEGAARFPLQAILVNGRPGAILSPVYLGRRWSEVAHPDHHAALALGVNLLLYAGGRGK
jgi:hypothetical protein